MAAVGMLEQNMSTRANRCAFAAHGNHRARTSVACKSLDRSSDIISRRSLGVASLTSGLLMGVNPAALASGKGSLLRKKIPLEDYMVSDVNGLKMYDVLVGRGPTVAEGTDLVVHWDVLYKGIDVISSRLARTLGGNRTIAEPLEFTAGEPILLEIKTADSSSNALFVGGGGPRPPSALSTSVIGMKEGGIRSVIVDIPALGYKKRVQELPPGAEFELRIEILGVKKV